MNTVVSFPIAKLLKEKGFNIPTNRYYEHALTSKKDSETNNYTGSFGWKKGETNLQSGYFVNNKYMADLSNENWYMCSAPTIAEVVMWLYKKYGIWISLTHNFSHFKVCILNINTQKNETYRKENAYDEPEEAHEAAIEYALDKLI